MNLVDSSGWLEYLADAPNAGFFAPPIADLEELIVPTICIYEVFKVLFRQRGEDAALEAAAMMHLGHVVDLDSTLAMSAAKLSVELGLSLADAVILQTARVNQATLWTQDAHFKGLNEVRYVGK